MSKSSRLSDSTSVDRAARDRFSTQRAPRPLAAPGLSPSVHSHTLLPSRCWPEGVVSRLTRDDVVQLQREQGNQFVLRLLGFQEPAASVQRSDTATLDAATKKPQRANLQILENELIEITATDLLTEFKDKGKAPVDDVKFGPDIPAEIRPGLEAVGNRMLMNGPPPFRFNVVTNVALNLKPFGGIDGVFRFTLLKRKTKPATQLIVEQVSAAPPADPSTIDLATQQKRFDTFDFKLGSDFEGEEARRHLFTALARVPDSTLNRVRGLTFDRLLQDQGSRGEDGFYEPNTHHIVLFGGALRKRANSSDASGASWFTDVVLHEIGHAVDFASRAQAILKLNALNMQLEVANIAKVASEKEQRRIESKVDTTTTLPTPGDEAKKADELKKEKEKEKELRKNIAKLQKDRDAMQAAVHSAKRSSESTDFTTAKGTDISKFGETDKGEDFAELFTIFTLDPELLRSLRPDAFKYFSKALR